jgi:hypothetical protein
MKVKKCFKEKKVDHTSNYKQDAKGPKCTKSHVFQNCPDDVCRENNWHKHYLYKKQEEDQSPYLDFIVASMSDSLDDQNAHVKVLSSHFYEQQTLMKNIMTQICQTCTTW